MPYRPAARARISAAVKARLEKASKAKAKSQKPKPDLEGVGQIAEKHISEAVQYRTLDRAYWQ